MPSSFFTTGQYTQNGQLASLHLNRDQLLPVKLSTIVSRAEDEGYAEGVVTNTKFGSFPHSTLIGIPWGSQVLASKVDTGTRGRIDASSQSKKRKASAISTDSPADSGQSPQLKQATSAGSGFIHVLPPTPESWTTSLPHRTQVVYTPDYSYILQRIRARPGSTLIEAGSGSGSFTHAAARAVFQGVSEATALSKDHSLRTVGKVFTFEFHAERHEKVEAEMVEHELDSIVTATHRDVYKDGFWLRTQDNHYLSPRANAVFLDLPAPWEALPHLTRTDTDERLSALDPSSTTYICTFSPCIEQVQKTVSVLRRLGWLDIEMVEIQHKRIDVRREYTGLEFEGMRGINAVAATVDEALGKLKDVEEKSRDFHGESTSKSQKNKHNVSHQKQQDAAKLRWDQGRLVHRSEPELKTHTSYLVFAVLPREWTEQDEKQASMQAGQQQRVPPHLPKSQKQLKREAKHRRILSNGDREHIDTALDGSTS